jgi:glutamate synthase (NADPH/NADH) small chain
VEYIGREGKVTGLKVKTDTGEEILETDVVLVAIGSKPARRIVSTTEGIEVDEKGYVITREKPYGMCTLKGVFAGGDVVHQPATVVLAMKEAKKVAEGIAAYVDAKKLLDL